MHKYLCPNWTQVNHENGNGLDTTGARIFVELEEPTEPCEKVRAQYGETICPKGLERGCDRMEWRTWPPGNPIRTIYSNFPNVDRRCSRAVLELLRSRRPDGRQKCPRPKPPS